MPGTALLKTPVHPRRITVSVVREALRAVVAEHPGRADRRAVDGLPARYVDKDEPSCLVAKVLAKLGFSLGVLRALDQEHPVGELLQPGVKVAESRHPALRKIDPLARQLLQYIQDCQDRGDRWARIVDTALTPSAWTHRRWEQRRKPWLFPNR